MTETLTSASPPGASPITRRRTFAIISHPDAGKTTLTEKLLLFGGAIQLAGAVKARGERRRARSDWMKVERERGISVTASVMTFEYAGCTFNLLDTPGHEDFSEDTYRTLTAVDSAVMVIDAAKGIETADPQAVRGLPAARRADHHLHQQDGPRGPRPVRAARRDRADPRSSTSRRRPGRSAWARTSSAATTCATTELVLFEQRRDVLPEGVDIAGLDDPKLDAPAARRGGDQAARGGRDGARPAARPSTSQPTARAT